MADHVVRLDPARLQRGENGKAGRYERRLLNCGIDELVLRTVETEVLKVEAGGLATDAENLHRFRKCLRYLTAHAGFEGPLPRETKRDGTFHLSTFPSERWTAS
jgi:hypothetical protein